MADAKRLTAPLVDVTMADGASWRVQAINADLIRWDRTRAKQRPPWPNLEDAPFLWVTFVAWAASRREHLTALDFEQFETDAVDVSAVPDETGEAGDPTRPGAEPG